MKNPEQDWQKLVEAARRANPDKEQPKLTPPGFAERIVNLRESIVSLARVMFWRRWTIMVALLCFVVFLAILSTLRCSAPSAPLIDTPYPPSAQPLIR